MDLTSITDKSLHLGSNQIGAEGAKALSLNTTLTTLYLNSNQIGDEAAKALSLNTTLTTLYLRYNRIGDEGAKALSLNTTLMTLDLGGNQIGDEGAKALNLNTTLTNLYLYDNQIGADLLSQIKEQMEINKIMLKKRRSLFISQIILLNIIKTKENYWSRLVPDLRNKVFDIVAGTSSLGTTIDDSRKCIKFVHKNIPIKTNMIIRGKDGQYRC
jgi:hypothetical protein